MLIIPDSISHPCPPRKRSQFGFGAVDVAVHVEGCCNLRSADSTWVESNLHPAKGGGGGLGMFYFHTDPLHPPAHSTCLCLFWIKVPVWWSIFTFNLLMLAAPHKPTRGGSLAWSEFKMHYYFILLDFSDQRTCWSGRMNVNGPCLLSLQQFQIIEVAFLMYAYYTKAPLWIREREKKVGKMTLKAANVSLHSVRNGKVPVEDAALGQEKRFSVWK